MKMDSYILFLVIMIVAGYSTANGQTIYHVDPNNTVYVNQVRTVGPTLPAGIHLFNSSSGDISILVSDDNTKWDTLKMEGNTTLSYRSMDKYILLYTSATNFCHRELTYGNAYTIYWDKVTKRWDIK